MRLTI